MKYFFFFNIYEAALWCTSLCYPRNLARPSFFYVVEAVAATNAEYYERFCNF